LQRQQREWLQKEQLYLRELDVMSREVGSLRDVVSKNRTGERIIVTSLPQSTKAASNTYQDRGPNKTTCYIRVDKYLEGKKRWEKTKFSESLRSWGVPAVVCQ
jgi:hypothetical protein